jgi:hypothetical protein
MPETDELYRLGMPDVALAPWHAPATFGVNVHGRF